MCSVIYISIHAPRAGCDSIPWQTSVESWISIHAPRAGCDVLPRQDSKLSQISIHAPRAGCDHQTASKGHSEAISIHAPRAGCDLGRKACPARTVHFNPRTPCGVRQPRAPATGATYLFQSTHPVRGATREAADELRNYIFQSTHPVRGATRSRAEDQAGQEISIHAPRAGCDTMAIDTKPPIA